MSTLLIDDIINEALKLNVSDIHIKSGKPPYLRIDGELITMDIPPVDKLDLNTMILGLFTMLPRRQSYSTNEVELK